MALSPADHMEDIDYKVWQMERVRSSDRVRVGKRWAASLDRSALSIFASEKTVFRAVVAFELETVYSGTFPGVALLQSRVASAQRAMHKRAYGYDFPYALRTDVITTLRSEVFFWWSKSDMHLDYMAREEFQRMRDYGDFLTVIADNPTEHPFYDNGVFDREFIARCRSNGVDAALAAELSNSR